MGFEGLLPFPMAPRDTIESTMGEVAHLMVLRFLGTPPEHDVEGTDFTFIDMPF